MLELSSLQATVLAILIPLLSIGLPVLLNHISKNGASGIVGKLCSYLTRPIPFESLAGESHAGMNSGEKRMFLTKQIVLRLIIVYVLLALFLLGSTIAIFYQIIIDLAMVIIDPGFVSKTWTVIVIDSPFSGGWYGSLPWYGQRFLPPAEAEVFHETWSWIFFSAGITDDATFFRGATQLILIPTILLSLLFLLPLGIKSIRESFLPSLYLFNAGMLVSTRGIFGCFGQAWNLEFNNVYIQYGLRIVTGGQLQVTTEMAVISTLLVVILALYFVFLIIGGKLWRCHYHDHKRSYLLFMLHVTLSYWFSLLGVMVMGG
jgi:hypothetical protein